MANRNGNGNGDGAAPEGPTDIQGHGWWAVIKRTVKEFRADNLTDWAAALTYYGVLALFPALIALVSIVGLLGKSTVNDLKQNIGAIPAAGQAKQIVLNTITNLSSHPSAAGIAFIFGLAVALWSASAYVRAFFPAANARYETGEARPFYKLRPLQMGVTLVMLLLITLTLAAIVITGPVTKQVGQAI